VLFPREIFAISQFSPQPCVRETGMSLQILLVLVLGARSEVLDFAPEMDGSFEFNDAVTSDIGTAMMTTNVGIVCYSDWANPPGERAVCNAFDASTDDVGPDCNLTEYLVKGQRFTVTRFSDELAIACFTAFGEWEIGGPSYCHKLTLNSADRTLTAGPALLVKPEATFIYYLSVASFTETLGAVCYQDTSDVFEPKERKVRCNVLGFDPASDNLTVSEAFVADAEAVDVVGVSLTKFSSSQGILCFTEKTEERAYCTLLTVTDTDISVPRARDAAIFSGVPSMLDRAQVSVVSLDETTGLVCYVVGDASAGDSASYETTCTPVGLFNGTVVKVGDDLVVDSDTTLDMSITAMSETAGIVCYMKNEERIGTCKGLVLSHGKDLTMGDARDITGTGAFKAYSDENIRICDDNPCVEFVSITRRSDVDAIVCYAGIDDNPNGRCTKLFVPAPTTTVTDTTVSETSSTTPHTTTESSTTTATQTSTLSTTTTATETTSTKTKTTVTTTPHTTTETSATSMTATEVEDSAGRCSFLAPLAVLAAFAAAAAQ